MNLSHTVHTPTNTFPFVNYVFTNKCIRLLVLVSQLLPGPPRLEASEQQQSPAALEMQTRHHHCRRLHKKTMPRQGLLLVTHITHVQSIMVLKVF